MQVFQMFSYVCCKYFYLDVCNGYTRGFKFFLVFYKCFRRMLQVFQLFRTYVANVFSRCCKSRSSVAHVAMWPIYSSCLLQLLGPPACTWVWRGCEQETVPTQIETERQFIGGPSGWSPMGHPSTIHNTNKKFKKTSRPAFGALRIRN